MKTIISVLVISMALLMHMPAFAENPHHDKESSSSSTSMLNMQEHMQSMNLLMNTLKKEEDPEKRQQLISKHMEEMEKMMHMMNQKAPSDGKSSMPHMPMPERMEMVEQRMGLMQMMMGQMIDHQNQAKDSNKPKYLKK